MQALAFLQAVRNGRGRELVRARGREGSFAPTLFSLVRTNDSELEIPFLFPSELGHVDYASRIQSSLSESKHFSKATSSRKRLLCIV